MQVIFGVPEDKMSYVVLDRELRSTDEVLEFGGRPKMTWCSDGYWYFGLRIHFESPGERFFEDATLHIGVKPLEKGMRVLYGQEFDVATVEDLDTFLDFVYRDLMLDDTTSNSQRARRPGFL
jgi:hypothetical protein